MENTEPKYEYHLKTWGGFYSESYAKIHHQVPGDFFFETKEERTKYIEELEAFEKELNAHHLMTTLSEGYCCRVRTVIHRVVEWEGKQYYSSRDLGVNYGFYAAKYMLKYKWTPGFNDYPLGEDFYYDGNNVKIVSEWITGADQNIDD